MIMHDPELHQIGRRRDSRLRVVMPATLVTIMGTHRVKLCDISQSGAHVRADEVLHRTGDAVLSWLHYEVFGRIVWASNTQAGIEFDQLLSPEALFTTRDIVDFQLAPDEEREHYELTRAWYQGYR